MNVISTPVGQSVSRIDGIAKVTGQAKYAAEPHPPGMLYGVVVNSPIARGRIDTVHDAAARQVPGVVEIMTHLNRPHTALFEKAYMDGLGVPGAPYRPLHDGEIHFNGQPVAVVLAETFEAAREAAMLVRVDYERWPHNADFKVSLHQKYMPSKTRSNYVPPRPRGDAARAYALSTVQVEGRYHLAPEHHNPMEMHATTVIIEDDGAFTVWDKTQGPQAVQAYLAGALALSKARLRVRNPYVGGAFGSGLRAVYNVFLATLAAKMLKRPVRVTLTRPQMFTHVFRPEAIMDIALGASRDGTLQSMIVEGVTDTSRFEHNMENIVIWGLINYRCPNATADYKVAPRDTYTSSDMRAPGAATGVNLLEMAIDEMAYACTMDPLAFRLHNYSDTDAMHDMPLTSKALREAMAQGARHFGWQRRSMPPGSMRDGRELIGWGMATGIWDAMFSPTSARARLGQDGRLHIATAASDIGTGTYTILAQTAAEAFGMPLDRIDVELGDSTLPQCPTEGGSWTAASAGAAVWLACLSLRRKLIDMLARSKNAPPWVKQDTVTLEGGILHDVTENGPVSLSLPDALSLAGYDALEAEETAKPGLRGKISQMRKARFTHSAVFCEVRVDAELGTVRVTRLVNAVAAGRILNPKTAASQIRGAMVMATGMALHEESLMDERVGRFMNHNFAEYHIPTHADIPDMDVLFVNEHDDEVSPLGVKGVGEIGMCGTAAAIANAIFHATGRRHRNLPITPGA
ncbi:aldehyde oxidase [Komagataeibacter nataicola]|uniref:Aldehyde oxidase n=1 Tax=Komagataeibacter nataicola TaxID=265960 RepID=A0A9N7H301_9PROT|nr:xanthine dehydrogenase family protein molybdopterin-binding subunit [Komagataeibacter nataicola]AQU87513.1 aldehyde oxidase [Komagataeibacter nataicola]PYD65435.1 aldehyde oxidase [Komagataeibacter nataicola]WEQ55255.1 xanthine dehydrogenase family protein molybdopterin-binding subunit [Komagataeibacter nataicola]WNM09863.1 xanthine dehydrogenase family protein molybdopterin-binding subunit [Komagataeibacter nataicola]GBR21618.1 aerobic-type carbon monoxide dehydrogenase large subunit CoxL/